MEGLLMIGPPTVPKIGCTQTTASSTRTAIKRSVGSLSLTMSARSKHALKSTPIFWREKISNTFGSNFKFIPTKQNQNVEPMISEGNRQCC